MARPFPPPPPLNGPAISGGTFCFLRLPLLMCFFVIFDKFSMSNEGTKRYENCRFPNAARYSEKYQNKNKLRNRKGITSKICTTPPPHKKKKKSKICLNFYNGFFLAFQHTD